MTDERIKQIASGCFWKSDVKFNTTTTWNVSPTRKSIEEAIKKALLEEKQTQQ